MLEPIWESGLHVLFVGLVATEPSPTLGFHHLHPRDRFWELLDIGGLTKGRIISKEERKAMAEGHARGNITDPVRQIFLQKKNSQLRRLGLGITYLNSSAGIDAEKDKAARPSAGNVETFIDACTATPPRCLAFTMDGGVFVEIFGKTFPGATPALGKQAFTIAGADVWLLGSSQAALKGDTLLAQEDQFYALGEWFAALGPPSVAD